MAGRKSKLTPDVEQQIVAYIRSGAFDWVAAQAAGIGRTTFYRWMQAGENGEDPYDSFYTAVREARAVARVAAEMEVRNNNPLAWLRYGPGRARPGEPGWTESHELTLTEDTATFTLALTDETASDLATQPDDSP